MLETDLCFEKEKKKTELRDGLAVRPAACGERSSSYQWPQDVHCTLLHFCVWNNTSLSFSVNDLKLSQQYDSWLDATALFSSLIRRRKETRQEVGSVRRLLIEHCLGQSIASPSHSNNESGLVQTAPSGRPPSGRPRLTLERRETEKRTTSISLHEGNTTKQTWRANLLFGL